RMLTEHQRDLADALNHDESRRPPQRRFRAKRSWQLAILEQMVLPKGLRAYNRPVAPAELKALFHAIDNRAREDGFYMLPIQDALNEDGSVKLRGLASEAQMSVSQCKRCLKAALDRGWLERKPMPGKRGSDRIWWRIVFDELRST